MIQGNDITASKVETSSPIASRHFYMYSLNTLQLQCRNFDLPLLSNTCLIAPKEFHEVSPTAGCQAEFLFDLFVSPSSKSGRVSSATNIYMHIHLVL